MSDCVCVCLCLVVVAEGRPVNLTCDSTTPGDVTWMFIEHGEVKGVQLGHERSLIVNYEDTPQLGEYSCWSGETKLWSAHLVLAEESPSGKIFILYYHVVLELHSYNHVFFISLFLGF